MDMKKIVYLLLSCILLTACEGDNYEPEIEDDNDKTEIEEDNDETGISIEHLDSNFQSYLLKNFDLNKDGVISEKEVVLITEIEIKKCKISSDDLKLFPNLERFISSYDPNADYDIKSMDFKQNPKLKFLDISFCKGLEEVDVSNNPELDSLSLFYNSSLKFFKINPELKKLRLWSNNITILDLSGHQHLKELSCDERELIYLDISRSSIEVLEGGSSSNPSLNIEGCIKLKKISFWGGSQAIDLADCHSLEEVSVGALKSLNIKDLPLLKLLIFGGSTNLKELDLSSNTALKYLEIDNAKIENIIFGDNSNLENLRLRDVRGLSGDLNLSNCKTLKSIYINNNFNDSPNFNEINLSGDSSLEDLYIWDTEFKSLNLSGCSTLRKIDCVRNKMTKMNIEGCSGLETLMCLRNELVELDVEQSPLLKKLDCSYNRLTSLKANAANLSEINCKFNSFNNLDFKNYTSLKSLSCGSRGNLDLSGCISLESLDCIGGGGNSYISVLNVKDCKSLKVISCKNNELTELLNLKDCISLKELNCHFNMLTSLDITQCTALTTLDCSLNNLHPSLDVSKNEMLSYLDCRYNNSLQQLIVNRKASISTLYRDSETKIVLAD